MSKLNYKLKIVDVKAGLGLSGIERKFYRNEPAFNSGQLSGYGCNA